MATVAIGDIHGQVKPLCDLLERVRPNVGSGDTVVFLGDYIDRGRDTKACIDAILEFIDSVPAQVVCLRGNHEDWMLETHADYTRHSWLLGMKALTTIRSYSAEAAEAIGAAAADARGRLDEAGDRLPYELFFDVMPAAHRHFFEALRLFHETAECVCAHGGVDPRVDGLAGQARALIWGAHGFPENYAGSRPVVYGHHDNARVDDDDWPHPRVIGATYGVDTIAHGILTALRLPGPHVLQSARYERRRG
jgi:serine/threonine protein phosphatase 1